MGTYARRGEVSLLREGDVRSIPDYIHWVSQELGVDAYSRRYHGGLEHTRQYLEAGDLSDLIATVSYIKRQQLRLKRVDSVPFYVEKARVAGFIRDEDEIAYSVLRAQADAAIYSEDEPSWIRRLSLAEGKALRIVFDQWKRERGNEV